MPPWPVNVSAGVFTDPNAPPEVLLPQLAFTANVFYNTSGQASCVGSGGRPPDLSVPDRL